MSIKISRRRFIGGTALAAASFHIVPRHVLGGDGHTPPSEELTRAVIGIGGVARVHLTHKDYQIGRLLAVCDVDSGPAHLGYATGLGEKEVKAYKDFRELLDRPDIDVVHLCTPPHWHALMSVAAAEAGKDIWCEKPMTRTIGEGQKVVDAVRKHNRIFRLNTWFRFRDTFYGMGTPVAPIKKLVDAGILGWPLTAFIGPSTGFDWKLNLTQGRTDLTPQPVPKELDYDMWLGPAPHKPYHPHRVHGTFRCYWDYDGGGLGDMGQHYLDPVQYLLGKDNTSPVEIEADADPQHPDACGWWRRIEMKYADGCKIILDSGGDVQPFLTGPDGKLFPGLRSDIPNLLSKLDELPDPAPQVTDFQQAVKKRKKFALNEENGHASCTLVNLAKIAVRLGRKLRFDPEKQSFVGDQEANQLVHQTMRGPWQL